MGSAFGTSLEPQSVLDQSKAEVHYGESAAVTSHILLQLLSHPSV